jgi:hypothetical protein
MGSRFWRQQSFTQCNYAIDIPFQLIPQTAATPTIGEGDPNGAYIINLAHTGTGVLQFTTKDPFPGLTYCSIDLALGTPVGQWSYYISGTQNATSSATYVAFSWTFTVSYFLVATATDLSNANSFYVWLRFRNSALKP